MTKKHFKDHAVKREAGGYVPLPHAVLRSAEWSALSPYGKALLMDLLAQYKGDNNGDLAAYWSLMQERGWKSKDTLGKALKELRAAEWIIVTRQGSRRKVPSLYAVTFYSIDYCGGKLEVAKTGSPSGCWRRPKQAAKKISEPRQPYHKQGNSPASRTGEIEKQATRPASRTYSGCFGHLTAPPAVLLSRDTTSSGESLPISFPETA